MRKSYMQITAECLSDERPIEVETDIRRVWLMISLIQLAYRHPGMTRDMRKRAREIMQPFEDAIISQHPEAKKVLADGWNRR